MEATERLFNFIRNLFSGEPDSGSGWYAGIDSALQYHKMTQEWMTEKWDRAGGTNITKELGCLDKLIENSGMLIEGKESKRVSFIDLGTGDGTKAIKIMKGIVDSDTTDKLLRDVLARRDEITKEVHDFGHLPPGKKEQMKEIHDGKAIVNVLNEEYKKKEGGIMRVVYMPVDFNKYMAQLAIMNIAMDAYPKFREAIMESPNELMVDLTGTKPVNDVNLNMLQNLIHITAEYADRDYQKFWTRLMMTSMNDVTPEIMDKIAGLNDDDLKKTADATLGGIETLIEKAGRIRKIEDHDELFKELYQRRLFDKLHTFLTWLAPDDVQYGFGENSPIMKRLKDARDYLISLKEGEFDRKKHLQLAKVSAINGKTMIEDASFYMDMFESTHAALDEVKEDKSSEGIRKLLQYWEMRTEENNLFLPGLINPNAIYPGSPEMDSRANEFWRQHDPNLLTLFTVKFAALSIYDDLQNSAGNKDVQFTEPASPDVINTAVLLPTRGIEADFTETEKLLRTVEYLSAYNSDDTNLVALLGQTLGNWEEETVVEEGKVKVGRKEFVKRLYESMNDGDYFLVGVDLRPTEDWDEEAIEQRITNMEAEYAITEDFFRAGEDKQEKDILEYEVELDEKTGLLLPKETKFVAKYNPETHKMEFRFEQDGEVVKDLDFSYKFTYGEITGLLKDAGFTITGSETHKGHYTAGGRQLTSGPEYAVLLARKEK